MKAYRMVNLELNMPSVREATRRVEAEVRMARGHKIRLLKLVHGDGSTGAGGKLRPAVRRELDRLQKLGYVKYYIPGEALSIFDENTRRAMNLCGELRGDPDIDRHNNGVTLVVL